MRFLLPALLALALPACAQTVTVTATDSEATPQSVTQTYTLPVLAPVPALVLTPTNNTTLPAAQVGVPYNFCFTTSGGSGTVNLAISGLPTGLTVAGKCITGTPTGGVSTGTQTGTTTGTGGTLTLALPLTTGTEALPNLTVGVDTDTSSWVPFTSAYEYNKPIDTAPVSPLSAAIIAKLTAFSDNDSGRIAADFAWTYQVVDSTQTPFVLPTGIQDPSDSDIVQVPFPSTVVCEGTCGDGGDDHALLIDKATGWIYNFFQFTSPSSFNAIEGFDGLSATPQRQYERSSTTASGDEPFSTLLKYDELMAHPTADVCHAIRATFPNSLNQMHAFMLPGSHGAGQAAPGTPGTLVMGMRLRLQANWQPAAGVTLGPQASAVEAWLKRCGLEDGDNGTNGMMSVTNDPRWNVNDLLQILGHSNPSGLTLADFDVVDTGEPIEVYGAESPKGAAPVISSFSGAKDASGTTMTFTANVSGATYQFVNGLVFFRGNTVTVPYVPGTYTLTERNQYGSSTATAVVQ